MRNDVHSERTQEPITRSIQLPCVRAMAFSQVGLFLDLSVFPVKISVSKDVHIKTPSSMQIFINGTSTKLFPT